MKYTPYGTPVETQPTPTTGQALVRGWLLACATRGHVIDAQASSALFTALEERIDEALLDAWSRKAHFIRSRADSAFPSNGAEANVTRPGQRVRR